MRETFASLVDEVVRETARRNPAWATTEGYPGFDSDLADVSREAYGAHAERVRGWLDRLKGAEGGTTVDREALHFALDLDLFNVERLRAWEKNPDLASEFMDHLFPLLIRTTRPLGPRVDAMIARLEKAAAFLDVGRSRLDPASVPPLWLDVAVESVDQAPAFLAAVTAAGADAPTGARGRLKAAVAKAEAALQAHRRWLLDELRPQARGDWAIGVDAFDELLAARYLPHSSDDLWELGQDLVAKHREEVRETALTLISSGGKEPGREPMREALAALRRDHPPSFEAVLTAYRAAISDARAFVAKRGLVTVPTEDEAPLDVVETPAYLRHLIPFAAYVQPARFDARARGTYLVTPKVDLSAFPIADIRNTTVHEAYPGHHLQLVRARENPSLARFLVSAPEMMEGWALYSEALMGRHGFAATPAERFIRAKDALWRAVRIVLDVGLHTRRLGYAEAVAMLEEETGMSTAEAEAEVKRYTLSPAYNLSYLIGKIGFDRLRKEAEDRPGFDERAFHDMILAQGSLPLPLLAKAAFG